MNSAAKRLYGVEGPHSANGQGFNLLDHVVDELDAYTLDGVPVADKDHPLLRALKGEPYADVELLIKLPEQDEPHVHRFSGTRASTEPPFNILTIRDETVRWRAERRYRVAFEADPAPSVIARLSDTTIVEANEGMSELTGLSQEELQERALVDLKPLDSSEHLKDVAERLKEGKRVHKVKRLLLNADNDVVPVLLSARSIEVDGESCGIFTFIDMSELETARREQRETEAKLNSAIEEHAVEKAAMSRLVLTDSLTGIANRRALNIRMAEERSRAQRYDDTFSILVLDLDRFKSLNDTYGHTTGDRVLREVAQLFQEECREGDMAGRWGGEEFMMILPQIDLAEAAKLARDSAELFAKLADDIVATTPEVAAAVTISEEMDELQRVSPESAGQQVKEMRALREEHLQQCALEEEARLEAFARVGAAFAAIHAVETELQKALAGL